MAERSRSPGQLRDLIVQALRRSRRPLAAVELIDAVREHRPAFQSQVFRELLRLRRCCAIRKIHVAKGYVLDGDTRQISLFCPHCSELTALRSEALFDALDAVAATHGFRPEAYVVETAGRCSKCGQARES